MNRTTKNAGRKAIGIASSIELRQNDPHKIAADVFASARTLLPRVSSIGYRAIKQVGNASYYIRLSDVLAPDPSTGSGNFGVALLAGARSCQIFAGPVASTERRRLSKILRPLEAPDIVGVRFMPPFNQVTQIGNMSDIFITSEELSGLAEQSGEQTDGIRLEIICGVFRAVQEQLSARSLATIAAA